MREIEQLVQEVHNEWLSSAAIRDIVDLPSLADHYDNHPNGLMAEKNCPCQCDHSPIRSCCKCNNGIISRQISRKEAAEIPKMLLEEKADYYSWASSQDGPVVIHREILLPSGERVRLRRR